MNRTGLVVTLAIAVVVGALFAIAPQLDLDISALGYDAKAPIFVINGQGWVQDARWAARALITLLALPGALAIIGKIMWPQRRMLIEGRAALLLLVTIALGPGLVTNLMLKDHWGRARPIDVRQFGGSERFTPWWDPRGDCPNNCSFIAGEPSGAFWTLAPAALAPAPWQPIAYGGVLLFGAAIGVLRIGAGAHFFTDVVFAGVFMYLVVWLVHGFIYRWRGTRLGEAAIEGALARLGEAIRQVFVRPAGKKVR